MKRSRLLSLVTTAAGTAAGLRTLRRRNRWESANRRVAICIDYDDLVSAASRAEMPLEALAASLNESGATHVSLPERTLAGLIAQGTLTPQKPSRPRKKQPPFGNWNYFKGSTERVTQIAEAMNQRLPDLRASVIGKTTLVFGGTLATVGHLGLGFDDAQAQAMLATGLALVPRPIGSNSLNATLLDATMQSAGQIASLCAFVGESALGRNMQASMQQNGLAMVHFAQIDQNAAQGLAAACLPNVVLGHQFTSVEMMGMDHQSAIAQWIHLARERGVRLCFVNFFRPPHTIAALNGVQYVRKLKSALEEAGFVVSRDVLLNDAAAELGTHVLDVNSAELAVTGLATAGIGTAAISDLLKLPESLAIPLVLLGAAGAAALPFLEQAGLLAGSVPQTAATKSGAAASPVVAAKVLAKLTSALAPIAAVTSARRETTTDWMIGAGCLEAAAVTLAATTTSPALQLGVQAYQSFGVDVAVPLLGAAAQVKSPKLRMVVVGAAVAAWLLQTQQGQDWLRTIDAPDIGGQKRMLGEAIRQRSLRPARKWAGAAPFTMSLAYMDGKLADAATVAATLAGVMALVPFRVPERAVVLSATATAPSWVKGSAAGLLIKLTQP